ncbi:hypothetical protein BGZ58_002196, partial [Dissophora ornata]
IKSTETIGDLKDSVKTKKANDFSDVNADKLSLLGTPDIEKALAIVSGNIIQDKMEKEHEKLLKEVYISILPVEVVKFQIVRPDPEPELEGLQPINIDDNNFPQIFPDRHVKFLDTSSSNTSDRQQN